MTPMQRLAMTEARDGQWELADRIELGYLRSHVYPHHENGIAWWKTSEHSDAVLILLPIAIRRGSRHGLVVDWIFVHRCPPCPMRTGWDACSCEFKRGEGDAIAVVTDIDGLVLEEWPDDEC